MKKLPCGACAVLIATFLIAGLVACGEQPATPENNLNEAASAQQTSPPAPTPPFESEPEQAQVDLHPAYITILGERFSTSLTGLSLDGPLTNEDIAPLRYMTELTQLTVGTMDPFNHITDLSPLVGLANLEVLFFTGDYLSDISALSGLENLTNVHIFRTQVADISALAGLANLGILQLAASQITDITPLAKLTNLHSLDLSWNQIADITPLAGLTNLHSLNLAENQITDITALAGLANSGRSNLASLFLSNNQISDLSALAGLVSLEHLWLNGNPITDFTAVAHVENIIFEMQQSWGLILQQVP